MAVAYSLRWLFEEVCSALQEDTAGIDQSASPLYGGRLIREANRVYSAMNMDGMRNGRHELLYFVNTTADPDDGSSMDVKYHQSQGRLFGLYRRQDANDTEPTREEIEQALQYARKNVGPTNWITTYDIDVTGTIRSRRNGAGEYFRLWFLRQPNPLVSGAVSAYNSGTYELTAGTAEWGQSLVALANYYQYDHLLIQSGPGAGQYARIASNTAGGVFTLVPATATSGSPFSVNPTTDSVWCLAPWFPGEHMHFVAISIATVLMKFPLGQMRIPEREQLRLAWDDFVQRADQSTEEQWGSSKTIDGLTEGSCDAGWPGIYLRPDGRV